MKHLSSHNRSQLFILLESGAKFHVGVGLLECADKVAGWLEDLFPVWDDVDSNGLEGRI